MFLMQNWSEEIPFFEASFRQVLLKVGSQGDLFMSSADVFFLFVWNY